MSSKHTRSKYLEQGLCPLCGTVPEDGMKKCRSCREKKNAAYRRLKEKKICCDCIRNKCKQGAARCDECKAKLKEKRLAKISQGICSCGGSLDSTYKLCEKCRSNLKEKRQQEKLITFEKYGGPQCACCGDNFLPFLTMDHINGDGATHRKQKITGVFLYRWLRKNNYPSGFQVLCYSCNGAKKQGLTCPCAKIPLSKKLFSRLGKEGIKNLIEELHKFIDI